MDMSFNPKYVKKYANLYDSIKTALNDYGREVKEGKFPAENNVY